MEKGLDYAIICCHRNFKNIGIYVCVEDYKRFLTAWMKRLIFHCTFGIVSIFASCIYNLLKNYKLRKL